MNDNELLTLAQRLVQEQQAKTRHEEEKKIRTSIFTAIAPWVLGGLILLGLLVKDCVGSRGDPMDDSILSRREIVSHIEVRDSTGNGFRVVFATRDAVSAARLEEMRSRSAVQETFRLLQQQAPAHFGGDLMPVDIYDFAALAKEYVPTGLIIQNIFVCGTEKCKLYVRDNPAIENCARWFNFSTEQGNQYLSAEDIYSRTTKQERIYRYWRCSGNHIISRTDERFSHFSEDERLW